MTIKETTLAYLNKEQKRLLISLDNAKAKPNVQQSELDSLRSKLEVNSYLLVLVDVDIKGR